MIEDTAMSTKTAKTRRKSGQSLDRYLELVRAFPLRPIRSEAELDRATAIIHSLLDRDDLDPAEDDYLDVLGDLVERYEDVHYPIAPASDADMLRFLLDQKGVTQLVVANETGIANTTLSAVLNEKRSLTREHITKLARHFKTDPAIFSNEG
jgi:HTH-type transcriptional regulator/antitoxin HigA